MNTSIKTLDRPAGLADRVYDQLRNSIGSHQIRPGERLQEVTVALKLLRSPYTNQIRRLP